MVRTSGDGGNVLAIDGVLSANTDDWSVSEVRHFIKRTLKRMHYTAKTFFVLGDEHSAFSGCLFELALASDRFFMLDDHDERVHIAPSPARGGPLHG